jgi:Flp pilus assembly protein TadG
MAQRSFIVRARNRLTRLAGRFSRAERGATAVEFALVAGPFVLLIFAVIDVGRTIRTGQVQTTGGTAATFKTAVCARMSWLGSGCNSALSVDVRTYADYTTSNTSNSNTTMPTTMSWNPGVSGSIVLIRAYYSWPLITPLLQTGLQGSGGKRVIYAATAFSNEPYDQ